MKEGDFFPTRNLNDVLAHVFHYWSDEQMPVKSFDPETRLLVSSIGSCYTLHEDTKKDYARYRLENVFEGLTEPGDWYLDRAARTLYYLPCDGETLGNTALTAPVCERAFLFRNCADITVENITVRHFDWHIGEEKIGGQGVCTLPGVISFDHCTRCALKNSRVEHVGYYCVDIQNSTSLLIAGNTLRDMGAGGVKIMSCEILGKSESGSSGAGLAGQIRAIKYAADNGAVICQNSWGYTAGTISVTDWTRGSYSALSRAMEYFNKYAGLDENGNQIIITG